MAHVELFVPLQHPASLKALLLRLYVPRGGMQIEIEMRARRAKREGVGAAGGFLLILLSLATGSTEVGANAEEGRVAQWWSHVLPAALSLGPTASGGTVRLAPESSPLSFLSPLPASVRLSSYRPRPSRTPCSACQREDPGSPPLSGPALFPALPEF